MSNCHSSGTGQMDKDTNADTIEQIQLTSERIDGREKG